MESIVEMPLSNKNEIIISVQNRRQNSSEIIISVQNRSRRTANVGEIEEKTHLKSSSPFKSGAAMPDLKKTDANPQEIEMPLSNKNEIIISAQNRSQNSSEIIISVQNRSRTAEIEKKSHQKSSSPFKTGVAMPDIKTTDADPEQIEHENHLESSSQIKTGAAESDLNKVDVKNLSEIIKDEHQQVWFLLHFLPLFVVTVGSFMTAYRRNNDYFVSVITLGVLDGLLIDHFQPMYRSMPEKKLWMKFTIWFLYTALVLIFVFLYSYLWRWSFHSTVVVDLVVLALSLVLLYAWIIGDVVNYWKIWNSGKDEIDVTANPTIVAGK